MIYELPSVIKKHNNTILSSIKKTPNQDFKEPILKEVFSNLKDNKEIQKPKYRLGQLVRTADIKKAISKGDSTNWSYILYTITEKIFDIIPTCRSTIYPRD